MCPRKTGMEQEGFLMEHLSPIANVIIQVFSIEYIPEAVILKSSQCPGRQTYQTLGAPSSKYEIGTKSSSSK